MPSLLVIASRVEAAIQAYTAVRDFADTEEWKTNLKQELKNAMREIEASRTNNPDPIFIHPTLVALSIVLHRNEDLGNINRSHPDRQSHTFFDAKAEFPKDISDLLPSADRWWEGLAEAARRGQPSETALTKSPPKQRRRVNLRVSEPDPCEGGENEDVSMDEGEELEDTQRLEGSKVARAAAATRKRKGSSAASGGTVKRRAKSNRRRDPAGQRSGESNTEQGQDEQAQDEQGQEDPYQFQCDRCIKADEVCPVDPEGPCLRCKSKKVKCSLMPINPQTGKTDRHAFTQEALLDFRTNQKKEKEKAERLKKGKQRARELPDAGEPVEALGPVPSPSAPLASLGALTLDSGASSANTPADSPASAPLPPLPEPPVPAPRAVRKARKASSASTKSDFAVEVPMLPQYLKVGRRTSSRSRSDASLVSDTGNTLSRIAAMERKQEQFDARQEQFDARIAAMEKKQEKFEKWMSSVKKSGE